MLRKPVALLIATSLLSACYSFRGPEPVINSRGVVADDTFGPREGPLFERFRQATLRASGCPSEAASNPVEALCYRTLVTQADIDEFMRAGYALIESECDTYFAHMGRNQGRSRLGRDMIAPIGSLVTGIISIVRFENTNTRDDLIGSIALATATGRSALDVYDQHFLFGADNIDAVQRLVEDAQRAHSRATFTVDHSTFGRAVNHLEDNQAYCRPTRILSLVRDAIEAGRIVARAPSQTVQGAAGAPAPAAGQSDRVEAQVEEPRQ